MNLCGLDLACVVESSFDIYYGVAVGCWGPWARCLNHCLSISVGGAFVGVHRGVSSNWCVAGIWCCVLSMDRHMDFFSLVDNIYSCSSNVSFHVYCFVLVRLFKACIWICLLLGRGGCLLLMCFPLLLIPFLYNARWMFRVSFGGPSIRCFHV